MEREKVMNSVALKKRFCKDLGLPIVVYDNPYFYERVQAIDRLFGCIKKFDRFCAELEGYKNEQDYFADCNTILDRAIDCIKADNAFARFVDENFERNTTYQMRSLYVKENDNKAFISIDMNKANFSALHHYSPTIFCGCDTWEEYIGLFTSNEHIINSKYIRQAILGACNPKKQMEYEKYLMSLLFEHLSKTFPSLEVVSAGNDEIVFGVEKSLGFSLSEFKQAVRNCPDGIGELVRVEMFELDRLDDNMGWVKTIYSFNPDVEGKTVFKCVESDVFHQVVKRYFDEPITKNDLVFSYKGRPAKFLD